jgi:hypothetical protein
MVSALARANLFRLLDHLDWYVDPIVAPGRCKADVALFIGRLDHPEQLQPGLRELVVE